MTKAKFGPQAKTCSWAFVSRVFERFLTQVLLLLLGLLLVVMLVVSSGVMWLTVFVSDGTYDVFEWTLQFLPFWMFEWPPVFLWHNH